jgi:hypothetical protein
MEENDVRGKVGEEQGHPVSQAPPVAGEGDLGSVPEPAQRKADDEWLGFATEDPAFFIKPSDTA